MPWGLVPRFRWDSAGFSCESKTALAFIIDSSELDGGLDAPHARLGHGRERRAERGGRDVVDAGHVLVVEQVRHVACNAELVVRARPADAHVETLRGRGHFERCLVRAGTLRRGVLVAARLAAIGVAA